MSSVAVTVNVADAVEVGVPEITPVTRFRLSPAFNEPELIVKLYGATPPLTASCWLYTWPTLAMDNDPGNNVIVLVQYGVA